MKALFALLAFALLLSACQRPDARDSEDDLVIPALY